MWQFCKMVYIKHVEQCKTSISESTIVTSTRILFVGVCVIIGYGSAIRALEGESRIQTDLIMNLSVFTFTTVTVPLLFTRTCSSLQNSQSKSFKTFQCLSILPEAKSKS